MQVLEAWVAKRDFNDGFDARRPRRVSERQARYFVLNIWCCDVVGNRKKEGKPRRES